MKNIEKLINECIKIEESVVNDVFKVDVFKCKKELEDYKQDQALQLQQTGVSGSVADTVGRNCPFCGEHCVECSHKATDR